MTISDEFSNLPVSRQRKWQLRKARDLKCMLCGASTTGELTLCDKCFDKDRVFRGRMGRHYCAARYRGMRK